MKKRPVAHQLEDESRTYFKSLLPKEWISRDKSHDYGIDIEIEIFNEKNEATGKIFYVQIKSTATKPEGDPPKMSFKVDDLSYLASLPSPTLLIFYTAENKEVFWHWAHSRFIIKPNCKSFSIPLDKNNKWNVTTSESIEREYDLFQFIRSPHLSLPLSVSFSVETEPNFPITETDVYLEFQKESINNPGLITPTLSQCSASNATLKIYLSKERTIIYAGGNSSSIGIPPLESRDDLSIIIPELMTSIAILLGFFGHHNIAVRFYDNYLFKTKLEKHKQFLPSIAFSFYESGGINKCSKIIDFLIDQSNFNIALLLLLGLLRNANEDKAVLEQFALSKYKTFLAKMPSRKARGSVYYNIGHCFFGLKDYRKALHNFRLAKQHDPIYMQRDYFLSEAGGILFELGRFNFSYRSYSKAQKKHKEITRIPLYADALMYAGQYGNALEYFEEYADKSSQPKPIWLIKRRALKIIIGLLNITKQTRDIKMAIKETPNKDEHDLNILAKPLYHDALWSNAWWNYGIHFQSIGDYKKAFMAFFVAAAVNQNAKRAWLATTIYGAMYCDPPEIFFYIIDAFIELYGEQAILDIAGFMEASTNMPKDTQKMIIEIIIQAREIILSKKIKEPALFRLLMDDKTYAIDIEK